MRQTEWQHCCCVKHNLIDRVASGLTALLSPLSVLLFFITTGQIFFISLSLSVLQPVCSYLSLTFSLTVYAFSPLQPAGSLAGSAEDNGGNDGAMISPSKARRPHSRVLSARRPPPQIRGQINSKRRNVCVPPRVGLDQMACLFQSLICGPQCGFWSTNQMCTCTCFSLSLSVSLSLLRSSIEFHTPASLLCAKIPSSKSWCASVHVCVHACYCVLYSMHYTLL